MRRQVALHFEQEHQATIKDFNFARGRLVLVRNTAIEKSLNCKMRPRCLGPLIVIGRNRGGAYLLCELDGTLLDRPIAAFRVIPYFAHKSIPLPDNLLDTTPDRVRNIMKSNAQGDNEEASDTDSDDDRIEGIDDASRPASDAGDALSEDDT